MMNMIAMTWWTSLTESFSNNLIAEDRYKMILDGLQVTLIITLCAAVLGTLLGGLVCWMRMSRRQWLRQTARVYIDLMRGMPVLVLLMLMYYVVMAPIDATGVAVAVVTFAMNTAAYISEKEQTAHRLTDKMLDDVMADCRPITVRIIHSEQSLVTALDFMVEQMTATPLTDTQRTDLSALCRQVVEEPTKRGFRVKLII